MKTIARTIVLTLLLLLLPSAAAVAQEAQDAGPPTQTISKDELRAITSAVTSEVVRQLEARRIGVATDQPAKDEETALADTFKTSGTALLGRFATAVGQLPNLARAMGNIGAKIVDPGPDGRPFASYLTLLAATFAAAAAAAWAARRAFQVALPVQPAAHGEPMKLNAIFRLALSDLAAYVAFWSVCALAVGRFFVTGDLQSVTAQWLLWAVPRFYLYYTVFEICFRPGLPSARMVPLDTKQARGAKAFFMVIAFIIVVRLWTSIPIAAGVERQTMTIGLLFNNALFVGGYFWAAMHWKSAISAWIRDGKPPAEIGTLRNWIANCWVSLVGSIVLLVSATHAYGTLNLRTEVTTGLTWTLRIAIILVFTSALIHFLSVRLGTSTRLAAVSEDRRRLAVTLGQIARLGAVVTAIYYLTELWIVEALDLMTHAEWADTMAYLTGPFLALIGGYLAFRAVRYIADAYLHAASTAPVPAAGQASQAMTLAGSSRVRTLIPVLRLVALTAIVLVTALLVMSALGINITPLLAGASVIGLAISFGSQSLVKDIVSGFFFLADDAFRVGEYIECGKVKGTVEGFTLRSIRLRHQDGQLHTVPFGQLGEITNFSRDWTTVKFNLVLDRDVDLEQVRKIAKRIGLTLQEDPRFSEQTLDPLKLQGIVDVSETTVTVRFKFNAKPDNTVEIERAAKVELLKAFREQGMLAKRTTTPQSIIVQAPSRAPRKPAATKARKPAVAKA